MAREADNSLARLFRDDSSTVAIAGTVIVSAVLLGALVLSIGIAGWLLPVLLGLALVGFLTLVFLLSRRDLGGVRDQWRIDWETALPDIQRQNLNVEVHELSKILEVESGQISDLQSAYIVAEDLALRQIQQEENVPLMRHVTVAKTPFDALLIRNDMISCIDVSFLVVPDIRQEKIDAMIRKVGLVKRTFEETGVRIKVQLMAVVVTQLTAEDDDRLRAEVKNRFKDLPAGISTVIRLLDFESLQKIYVTD